MTTPTHIDRADILDQAHRAGWRGWSVAELAATHPSLREAILTQHAEGARKWARLHPSQPRVPRLFPYQGTQVPPNPQGFTPYRAL